jgi:chromosome segregation ATPase
MNEFDLRSFLYDNPLLESEKKIKAKKKELEKKEDKLDSIDMKDEDAKEKAKHHKGAIKNVKKEIKDLEKDLSFDEKAAKKEEKEAKAEAKAKKKKKSVKEGLTKEGLKDMIRERITSILNEDAELYEAEEDNVDVDVEKDVDIDVKDEVDVDDESVESDVEVKTSVPGADKDTSEVLGLLTKASEASDAFTDDPELKTQIGNTITYFTRKHVAKV